MAKEMQQHILEKVRTFLNLKKENDPIKLHEHLREQRNLWHPDKYLEHQNKQKAAEKFQASQELLDELEKFIEAERFSKSPKELILRSEEYKLITVEKEIDKKDGMIRELEEQIKTLHDEKSTLMELVDRKLTESQNVNKEKIESTYRPISINSGAVGLSAALILVLKNVDGVAQVVKELFPFSQSYLNVPLTIALVWVLNDFIRKSVQSRYMLKMAEEVTSPSYVTGFVKHLNCSKGWKEDEKNKKFSETDVEEYIFYKERRFPPVISYLRGYVVGQINGPPDAKVLVNVFIHNLLQKQLVDIADANELSQTFKIKKSRGYPWE